MTTASRPTLATPLLDLRALGVRLTARSSHAFTLAALANDAAGGHPSQRARISKSTGGNYVTSYDPRSSARWLRVMLTVGIVPNTSYVYGDGITVDLSITDGTNTVSASPEIPDGLRGDQTHQLAPIGGFDLMRPSGSVEWTLDLVRIAAAGVLSTTTTWRLVWTLAQAGGSPGSGTGSTARAESLTVEELPRWLIDDSEAYGQVPQSYLPRRVIAGGAGVASLGRLATTIEAAYDLGLRTYHCVTTPESAPCVVTSATHAALSGEQSRDVADPAHWRVRPRRMGAAAQDGCRVRWGVWYKTSGATGGEVRLHSGSSTGVQPMTLAGTSGVWTWAEDDGAYLATNGTDGLDVIWFDAKVGAGTLSIASFCVWDYPQRG